MSESNRNQNNHIVNIELRNDNFAVRERFTKMLEVLGDLESDRLCLEEFGLPKSDLLAIATKYLKRLELDLVQDVKSNYNPNLQTFNPEIGLYKVDVENEIEGVTQTFGSVYSMVDVTQEAEGNASEANALRTLGLNSVIGVESEDFAPWGLNAKLLPGSSLDACLT